MEVTIAGSPGWSETGGIWVAPEDAMKKYVWSETRVAGGKLLDLMLAQPPAATGPFLGVKRSFNPPASELHEDLYRDSLVVAFPTLRRNCWTARRRFPIEPGRSTSHRCAAILPHGQPAYRRRRIQCLPRRRFRSADNGCGAGARPCKVADLEIQAGNDRASLKSVLKARADASESPAPQQTYSFHRSAPRFFASF